LKSAIVLLSLTAAALLVQGYHPFSEDAEIYLPGVEKILNPNLFPIGQEFFRSHASMTLFPNLIAFSIRLFHLPMEVALFLWHLLSIFLFLGACWQLAGLLFESRRARWAAVCLMAGLLTLPVAGTALYGLAQYLNPRNLAAFAGIFAVTRLLEKKYFRALVWIVAAAAVHPLMWVFPFSFCALWFVLEKFDFQLRSLFKRRESAGALAGIALVWIPLTSHSPAYHEAAKLHAYHYIQNWHWYEQLGIIAPLVLLWWFARIAGARNRELLARVCRALVIYGAIYVVMAVMVDLPARFESLARLQPLRSLHFLYIVMFIIVGGFAGEFILKDRWWRWLLLFMPLAAGMFFAQRELFPASMHVEWPGEAPKNPWAQAFLWARRNTPVDALFALDPEYMNVDGEDEIGFRCLAQRSRMADDVKDNGVVSMFPLIADEWWSQVKTLKAWKSFNAEDFARLKQQFGVGWVVVQQPATSGLNCPYQNTTVQVCQVP
jgi:hypothetical protein